MARRTLKMRGFRELDAALGELPAHLRKPTLMRIAKAALEPMREQAQANAHQSNHPYTIGSFEKGTLRSVLPGRLKESIAISEKRTRRAKKTREPKRGIKIAMGVASGNGALFYGAFEEFGTIDTPAHPFMRPAWDAEAEATVNRIAESAMAEIKATANRSAKRLSRAKKKG